MKKSRQKIINETEKSIVVLAERLSNKVEKEIQKTLDDWHKRYPRHTFKAFQSHGMLTVEVYPQIGNHHLHNVDYIRPYLRRGQ